MLLGRQLDKMRLRLPTAASSGRERVPGRAIVQAVCLPRIWGDCWTALHERRIWARPAQSGGRCSTCRASR